METVATAAALRDAVAAARAAGRRVGLVPTMGALHAGHLALVEAARRETAGGRPGLVVASVFVNPTQFGPHEDFARYPRQPEKDSAMLVQAGCDLLFMPAVETIYPPGATTTIDVAGVSAGLEGAERPGHFRGVATVVSALFHLVAPDVAVFGEKDAQQLAVLRRLVRDQHFPVEIVGHPIVREADGLALSSRNAYLTPEERRAAAVLFRTLERARRTIAAGEREAEPLKRLLRASLAEEPLAVVDYAEVVDAETFQPVPVLAGRIVIPLAVRFGRTRLLDNLQLAVA
jgi:pantoate--beta-alanine ligase